MIRTVIGGRLLTERTMPENAVVALLHVARLKRNGITKISSPRNI